MAEEAPEIMNLDLNLDPAPETGLGSVSNESMSLDEFFGGGRTLNRGREALRNRLRRRILRIPDENENLYVEFDQSMLNLGNSNTLEAGEGSVAAAEETTIDARKACENINGFSDVEVYEKKDNVEKGVSSDGSFFDCNICFDLAREPVVTCCGHLFCWSCLYRWLNVHSDAKECPVCKGEVTDKTLTPIYGQGKIAYEPEEDSDLKIPPRPTARRVDSWRQTIQRTGFSLPLDEVIRTLGNRFHPTQDPTQDPTPSEHATYARQNADRARSVLNRFLSSRGLRREQSTTASSVDDVDLMPSGSTSRDVMSTRIRDVMSTRIHSLFLERQSQLRRSVSSAMTSADRIVESYFQSESVGRNPEQPIPVDDRDSFSSIAAVINSESQMDNAVEINSGVSLSASSSRRRTDVSRDVDGVNPPPTRRRRLH